MQLQQNLIFFLFIKHYLSKIWGGGALSPHVNYTLVHTLTTRRMHAHTHTRAYTRAHTLVPEEPLAENVDLSVSERQMICCCGQSWVFVR